MPNKREKFVEWLSGETGQWFMSEESKLLSDGHFLKPQATTAVIGFPPYQQGLVFPHTHVPDQQTTEGWMPAGQVLSLLPESQEVLILPHLLEFTPVPLETLKKALTLVQPFGHLVIVGFNSNSWWQLGRWIRRDSPPMPKLHAPARLQSFLERENCELFEKYYGIYQISDRSSMFTPLMEKCLPFTGAVYILVMRKLVPGRCVVKPAWRRPLRAAPEPALKGAYSASEMND